MRTIVVEVPGKHCGGCKLIILGAGDPWTWKCYYREWTDIDTSTARPIKPCREAEVTHER